MRDAIDGALVSEIGFDAKGNCYVKVSNLPPGQEEALRKLIDEFSKQHLHLKTIQQQ